jgi:hypothetical protein
MNAVPDLTPPGKSEKPKKERVVKVATPDPNPETGVVSTESTSDAPKKERAPRSDYGYRPDATITINATKDISKIRGNVKAWYDRLKEFDGKTAIEFIEANKGNEKDPPRGWLRHFAQHDYVHLVGGTVAVKMKGEEKVPEDPTPAA